MQKVRYQSRRWTWQHAFLCPWAPRHRCSRVNVPAVRMKRWWKSSSMLLPQKTKFDPSKSANTSCACHTKHTQLLIPPKNLVIEWCAGKKDAFWWEQSAVNHLCACSKPPQSNWRFQRELVCEHAQSTTPRSESSTKLPVLSPYRKYPSVWTHRLGKIDTSARTGSSYTEHCIRPSLDLRKSPP